MQLSDQNAIFPATAAREFVISRGLTWSHVSFLPSDKPWQSFMIQLTYFCSRNNKDVLIIACYSSTTGKLRLKTTFYFVDNWLSCRSNGLQSCHLSLAPLNRANRPHHNRAPRRVRRQLRVSVVRHYTRITRTIFTYECLLIENL